jgi:sensor domain CHASE-containing protein
VNAPLVVSVQIKNTNKAKREFRVKELIRDLQSVVRSQLSDIIKCDQQLLR